jgi:hypothetical protein
MVPNRVVPPTIEKPSEAVFRMKVKVWKSGTKNLVNMWEKGKEKVIQAAKDTRAETSTSSGARNG